jgi:hypothetical protein
VENLGDIEFPFSYKVLDKVTEGDENLEGWFTINLILSIFRNFSCVKDNERYLANHPSFLKATIEFLSCKRMDLSLIALEIIANISTSIYTPSTQQNVDLLSYTFGFLCNNNSDISSLALEIFAKLSQNQDNFAILSLMDISFFKRIEQLMCLQLFEDLYSPSSNNNSLLRSQQSTSQLLQRQQQQQQHNYVTDVLLNTISNYALFGDSNIKVIMMQETRFPKILLQIISNVNVEPVHTLTEFKLRAAEKAAAAFSCLASEPKNRDLVKRYQENIIELALSFKSKKTHTSLAKMLQDLFALFLED